METETRLRQMAWCVAAMVVSAAMPLLSLGCHAEPSSNPPAEVRIEPAELVVSATDENCLDGKCPSSVTIVNDSASPVTIQEITTTCMCSKVGPVWKRLLPAGEAVDIPLTIRVPDRGKMTSRMDAVVKLDGEQRQISARIISTGRPEPVPRIIHFPDYVDLKWDRHDNATGQLWIRTIEEADFQPYLVAVRPDSTNSNLVIKETGREVEQAPEPHLIYRDYFYEVSFTQPAEGKINMRRRHRVIVRLADKQTPTRTLYVQIRKARHIHGVPQSVFINRSGGYTDNEVNRRVAVVVDEGFVPVDLAAEPGAKWIEITTAELARTTAPPLGFVSFRVHADELVASGESRSEIVVTARNEEGRVLRTTIKVAIGSL